MGYHAVLNALTCQLGGKCVPAMCLATRSEVSRKTVRHIGETVFSTKTIVLTVFWRLGYIYIMYVCVYIYIMYIYIMYMYNYNYMHTHHWYDIIHIAMCYFWVFSDLKCACQMHCGRKCWAEGALPLELLGLGFWLGDLLKKKKSKKKTSPLKRRQ